MIVLCDPVRDGLWKFESDSLQSAVPSFNLEEQDIELSLKEKGTYEPASLVRSKPATTSSFGTTSLSVSPSSLEHTIKGSQSFNSRAVQANFAQSITNGPPVLSPAVRSAISSAESWPILKDIHESFVSAVLGTLVYFLCYDHGFVPLNSRTLILTSQMLNSSPESSRDSSCFLTSVTLATLDISLTSLGALVLKAHSDVAPGLQKLVLHPGDEIFKLVSGASLWLAPGGNAAKFYRIEDDKNLPPTLPISELQTDAPENRQPRYMGVTIHTWKTNCLEWLSGKGLDSTSLEEGGWIFVQVLRTSPFLKSDYLNPILEDLTIVPWPAALCFQAASSGVQDSRALVLSHNTRDALSFAEDWFILKDDRAALLAQRLQDRKLDEARAKEQADVDTRIIQPPMHSPAALRRGSNAGAMYPTPPDAVHHHIGATPSFDYAASTPGNVNLLFAPEPEPEPVQHNAIAESNLLQVDWLSSQKQDRSNANANASAIFNFNDNHNDNVAMFEDGAGDFFGAITDADFNFFDEPDDVDQHTRTPEHNIPVVQEISQTLNSAIKESPEKELPEKLDIEMPDVDHIKMGKRPHADKKSIIENGVATTNAFSNIVRNATDGKTHMKASPPFDMQSVFKTVVQNPLLGTSNRSRKLSVFDKIDFEKTVALVKDKYGIRGRFNFPESEPSEAQSEQSTLPTTKYLARRRKSVKHDHVSHTLPTQLVDESNIVEAPEGCDDPMLYSLIDSDLTSQISEPDDTSHTTVDDYSLAFKPGAKRKWTLDSNDEDISSSFHALGVEYAHSVSTPLSISGSQLSLLEGDPADWSLTTYFTSLEPDIQLNALSDVDSIAAAQILADQAVSGTLHLPGGVDRTCSNSPISLLRTSNTKELMHTLLKVAKVSFGDISCCTMRSFLELQGIPALNQALRLPPRPVPNARNPSDSDIARPNTLYTIPLPRLELRRADTKLSVLPSAVKFWENLGLGPSRGSKDIAAVCVYPQIDGVSENCGYFLDQMRNSYESFRLGNHERIVSTDLPDGHLPYLVDPSHQISKAQLLATLKETISRLNRVLVSMPINSRNLVVYFVYPLDDPALLVNICTAFHYLFNLYRKLLSEKKIVTKNELVLQLVPLDMISLPTSIAVPSPSQYSRLAMEVYDRCIDFASYSIAPAILLEQPLAKSIDFKLNANPSASLLLENSCLHIAYAQSIDDRWITAAWTDNKGTQQMTASYCLGRKHEPLSRQFSDIAQEIWETTMEILSKKRIHWRIMITRIGVMDPSETEFWTSLASTESEIQLNLTLITVQTDPSLRLLPTSIMLLPTASSTQAVITPVSTPQAMQSSMVSPSTPARDNNTTNSLGENLPEPDGDARLLDSTDQCWGAILSHRLNNSNSLLEVNPSLISGYLVKRGGTSTDQPPIVMEVNIIHCELAGNPRTFHEGLLKEILGYYRGLGVLARVRGVVDPVLDIRPWHIAAAEKAVKALYMLM